MHNLSIERKAENQFFFHPRYENHIPDIDGALRSKGISGQFCILSSGTSTHHLKGYALSFEALMASATSVNEVLRLTPHDRWGLCLIPYHIAGLSIYARSSLLGHRPVPLLPWTPNKLVSSILQENVSVISLVPTQIYDLVAHNISAPSSLKAVLVGGDFFGEELESRAKKLGWPTIRTFGMTEVASSLAIGGDLLQGLNILRHHQVKTDHSKKLWVKSHSLFSCEFQLRNGWEIRLAKDYLDSDGFYPLSDKAEILDTGIIPLGRDDGSFKSSGHLFSMPVLKNKLESFMLENHCWGKMDLFLTDDARMGKVLTLVHERDIPEETISKIDDFFKPNQIKLKYKVDVLPKTELGKTKRIGFI